MSEDRRLQDERDIEALLYRYARAVDTKDWQLYRSVFTEDAHIDYTSAGATAGRRDEVADWLAQGLAAIAMSMHYITNIEIDLTGGQERSDRGDGLGDTATVRAMFYNPMQLPAMTELSYCGGYYHHEMVRTPHGWRSRHLHEDNIWFLNPPTART